MEKFKLEGTSEGLIKAASKCDQVAQGLAQASFLNLQGWRLHILSGQPVSVHELIGILPHILKKNFNFQLFSLIYNYVFYNFLALLNKENEKDADKSDQDTIDKCEKLKYKIHIRKLGFINLISTCCYYSILC